MPIEPVSNRPAEISVAEPITPAYERVKQMLFNPFDISKWFTIGFCAWLAFLGEAGGGFHGSYNGGSSSTNRSVHPAEEFRHFLDQAHSYILLNLFWIIPLAAALVLVGLALWILFLWLGSRGKFMFLHCVVFDKAEVKVPWDEYAVQAQSLFWFRLILSLSTTILALPLFVIIAVIGLGMFLHDDWKFTAIMMCVGLGLLFIFMCFVFGIINKFLNDFVIPIQFLRRGSCMAAWREFYGLLTGHFWKFVVYLLFQIVLSMAIGALVLVAVLITCCIAGCLMLIPYIGTVLLLPVLIFKRAYPLYYLAQYGPQYDVFPKVEAPTTPPVI